MRPRKGREAGARGLDKFRDTARRPATQAQNANRQCEQILDAMVHLSKQKLLSIPHPLEFRNVGRDFRCANDLAFFGI
jgi:hypothetical protein